MPASSLAEAITWKSENISSSTDSAELLRLARLRLVDQQEIRARLENEVRSGHLVDETDVERATIEVCSATMRAMKNLVGILPPILEGLSAPQIAGTIRREFDDIFEEMHHGDFFDTPAVRRAAAAFVRELDGSSRYSPAVADLRNQLAAAKRQIRTQKTNESKNQKTPPPDQKTRKKVRRRQAPTAAKHP